MQVRLTQQEINGVIAVITAFTDEACVKLYLYGSRTDITAKGGDIDLLLVCQQSEAQNALLAIKHSILAEIKDRIGEQKIDLLITTTADLSEDPFLQLILPKAVLLYSTEDCATS